MNVAKPKSFQEIVLRLQNYWSDNGCAILQPYDMEVGAGTFHPATTLRSLGKIIGLLLMSAVQKTKRWKIWRKSQSTATLLSISGHHETQSEDFQELYLGSLEAIGLSMSVHDVRFVEDDWESPTLGAWGLDGKYGATVWK